jgi:hypothetical protein
VFYRSIKFFVEHYQDQPPPLQRVLLTCRVRWTAIEQLLACRFPSNILAAMRALHMLCYVLCCHQDGS